MEGPMRHRGFTFVEILIVMVLIGIIAAMGIPRIRDAVRKTNVRASRAAVGTIVAKARAAAVQPRCTAAARAFATIVPTAAREARTLVFWTASRMRGIPIAAMMPISTITIRISTNVNPRWRIGPSISGVHHYTLRA